MVVHTLHVYGRHTEDLWSSVAVLRLVPERTHTKIIRQWIKHYFQDFKIINKTTGSLSQVIAQWFVKIKALLGLCSLLHIFDENLNFNVCGFVILIFFYLLYNFHDFIAVDTGQGQAIPDNFQYSYPHSKALLRIFPFKVHCFAQQRSAASRRRVIIASALESAIYCWKPNIIT